MTERMDEQPPENGRTMPLSQEYIDYVLARRRKEDLAAEAERANAALRRARRELETAERALKAGALKMVETRPAGRPAEGRVVCEAQPPGLRR